jgi:hypothetical protein
VGDERPLPSGVEKTTIGPLDRAGIWAIATATPTNMERPPALIELACNLANREESDLRPAESLIERQPPAVLAGFSFNRPLWFYLIVVAFFLATAEWYLYQRRWIT